MNVVRTLDGLEGTCSIIPILFPPLPLLSCRYKSCRGRTLPVCIDRTTLVFLSSPLATCAVLVEVQFLQYIWELVCAIPALKRITASATAASTANSDACFSFGARLQIRECSASFAFWVLPLWQRCSSLLSARRCYTGSSALLTFSGSL